MATIRLVPSTYYLSNSSYLSVNNASNMYTNTDSTTNGTVTNTRNSTSSYYIYLRGFNFDDVPSNATVTGFTVKLKAYQSGGSTSSSYVPYLANDTTTLTGCTSSAITTSTQTRTFSCSYDWATISGYGNNFGIRINCRRNSRNTQSVFYIYGAEIEVTYSESVETNTLYLKENGAWTAVSNTYVKQNGVWVEQSDLTNVFNTSTKYIKGN